MTAELVLRVQLDPTIRAELEVYPDVAGRPVLAVKHDDVPPIRVGAAMLRLLRAAARDQAGDTR